MVHNMSRYDLHFIIKALESRFPNGNMTVIAESTKKYISASVNIIVGERLDGKPPSMELRFLDSLRFMQSSLDWSVQNLVGVMIFTAIVDLMLNSIIHSSNGLQYE